VRHVRNFWLCAEVDGKKHALKGGPRNKRGGLCLTLFQRSEGFVKRALRVSCTARCDGSLCLEVEPLLPASQVDGHLVIHTRR
jgi:hypothetical protein